MSPPGLARDGSNIAKTWLRGSRTRRGPLLGYCVARTSANSWCALRTRLHDLLAVPINVRFSNRPFEVKRFQTIHYSSVDVACGLVLLFGLGAKALPVWDSKTRWNNLSVGLAVRPTAGSSGHTNSPH